MFGLNVWVSAQNVDAVPTENPDNFGSAPGSSHLIIRVPFPLIQERDEVPGTCQYAAHRAGMQRLH